MRHHRSLLRAMSLLIALLFFLGPVNATLWAASTQPTTKEHWGNFPRYIREDGFWKGLSRWFKEDWRMTVADSQKVATTLRDAFTGSNRRIVDLEGKSRQEILTALDLPEVAARTAEIADRLPAGEVLELTGGGPTDETTVGVRRALLKRKIQGACQETARQIASLDEKDLKVLLAGSRKVIEEADDKSPVGTGVTTVDTSAAQPFMGKLRILPKGLADLILPRRLSDFMFTDNAWIPTLAVHMVISGIIIQSTAHLTGAAAGAAILLTSAFVVGGISISWVTTAALGALGILSYRFVKWLVKPKGVKSP